MGCTPCGKSQNEARNLSLGFKREGFLASLRMRNHGASSANCKGNDSMPYCCADTAASGGNRFNSSRLGRLGVRLLFDTNPIGQLDELLKIPPFFFAHLPSVRTRKINRYESVGGKGRTYNQLRFLLFLHCFGHDCFLQMDANSTTDSSIRILLSLNKQG